MRRCLGCVASSGISVRSARSRRCSSRRLTRSSRSPATRASCRRTCSTRTATATPSTICMRLPRVPAPHRAGRLPQHPAHVGRRQPALAHRSPAQRLHRREHPQRDQRDAHGNLEHGAVRARRAFASSTTGSSKSFHERLMRQRARQPRRTRTARRIRGNTDTEHLFALLLHHLGGRSGAAALEEAREHDAADG